MNKPTNTMGIRTIMPKRPKKPKRPLARKTPKLKYR